MRIIAGTARSRQIDAPPGTDTRPTLDRVKESVFGAIQFEIEGRYVLDLFAGSGNLGIEALSRGASHADFCDSARICTDIIRANLDKLKMTQYAGVFNCDFTVFLENGKREGKKYGLVFLDPPYASQLSQQAVDMLTDSGMLEDYAIVCAEHSKTQEIVPPKGMCIRSRKIYKDVGVTILENDTRKGEII